MAGSQAPATEVQHSVGVSSADEGKGVNHLSVAQHSRADPSGEGEAHSPSLTPHPPVSSHSWAPSQDGLGGASLLNIQLRLKGEECSFGSHRPDPCRDPGASSVEGALEPASQCSFALIGRSSQSLVL